MLGSGASGALNGFEANSTAIFTTASAENGTGWPSGSAPAGDEPDGASEAASAPPTASCKNSRRCLSAIVFFVRSPSEPDRLKTARHGVAPSQDEKSALRRKPAASPARSILGGEVVYRFLRRRETHFSPSAKRRRPRAALRLETAAARGDIAQA